MPHWFYAKKTQTQASSPLCAYMTGHAWDMFRVNFKEGVWYVKVRQNTWQCLTHLIPLISHLWDFCSKFDGALLNKILNFQCLFWAPLAVCWLFFCVCPTPLLPQWHIRDLGHSAKSTGGRLHLNTHTLLTQGSQSGLTMLLSRHSVGTYLKMSSHEQLSRNTQSQSSQLAEPLWTEPGLKSGIIVRELISIKKNFKAQAGYE